jgi:hypothetical protein
MFNYRPMRQELPDFGEGDSHAMGGIPMQSSPSGMIDQQQLAQQQSPSVERIPADTLHKMYLAWEQAKTSEIHEQWVHSRYYHTKQWDDEEVRELERRAQPVVTKNRIKRKVDFLVGVEQRLRRDPKCYPRTPQADKAAPIATACLRFIEDQTKWQKVASDCMNDALVRGIGVLWGGAVVKKGRAEVEKRHIAADRFFYDPRSEKWDFSDSRYLGEHQWMDIDEAIELLPWASEMISQLADSGNMGSFSALPQEFDKEKNWHPWVDSKSRRIRVVSIWYKRGGQWMFDYLVGPVSLCPEGMDCVSPYRNHEDESVHPYRPWSPYVDESGDRYGVIRDMISSQNEINKRSSSLLYRLSVRQTKGEKGAVDDVDEMKRQMSRPDGHVEYNPGMVFDTIDQSQQIQGQFELLQEAKAEIENLGPNPGLLGRGVENQSGRAILAQQNSGMTELSPVFERMREWKLGVYHHDWGLIRQFWNGERYIRITSNPQAVQFLTINGMSQGPQGVQAENALIDMDVDIVLDEGPDTITMREELMDQLAALGPGAIPPELLIEMSNINEKDVLLQKLKEFRAPDPNMMELQQRMQDLEAMLKAAEIDKAQSSVELNRANALASMAKAGVDPRMVSPYYPIRYREPTHLEQVDHALVSSQEAQQQQQNQQHTQQAPVTAGPEAGQNGNSAALSQPQIPDPTQQQEPQIGQTGGLPMGPDMMQGQQ